MVRIMPPEAKACTLSSKVTPESMNGPRGLALVVSAGQGQAFTGNGGGEGEVGKEKTSAQRLLQSPETLAFTGH